MQTFVRSLMKEQHKNMFTALRLGDLDALLEDVCGKFEQPLPASKAPPAIIVSAPPPAGRSGRAAGDRALTRARLRYPAARLCLR